MSDLQNKMMTRLAFFVLTTLLCILAVNLAEGASQATIVFKDVSGNVYFESGLRKQLTCIATNADPKGDFVWLVGGEVVANKDSVRKTGEAQHTYQQTLEIDTEISMDNTEVECQYIQRDENGDVIFESSNTVNLRITLEDWPSEPFNAGTFVEGESARLTVPLKLYPEPTDLTWSITFANGTQIEIVPGDSDESNHFEAEHLVKVGDNIYAASLLIHDALTKEDAASTILLQVQLNNPEPHPISVIFDTQLESATQASVKIPQTTSQNIAEMSVGIWIIVAIIVIIILIMVGYCIYRKKCGNESSDGYANPPEQPSTVGKSVP